MAAGDGNDHLPPPTSLAEVERLIDTLYNAHTTPRDVQRINKTLQKLQKSPEGWQLANSLCSSSSEHVQFFAALTFMVRAEDASDAFVHPFVYAGRTVCEVA